MFTSKHLVQILLGILVIFMAQVNAAPMPLLSREESSELSLPSETPSPTIHSSYSPEHRAKVYAKPEAAFNAVQSHQPPEDDQVNKSNILAGKAQADNRTFVETHLALVTCLFILAPFVLCVALYPIFKYYKNRSRTSQVAKEAACVETADCSFEDKFPGTPTLGETNTVHGEPLPEYPRLIYVPPNAESGVQTIFGHFVSPCGRVIGVKDTWTLAGSRMATNGA